HSVIKTGAMTFLEAAFEVLRWEGRPLHFKELTERALGKKLLTFVGRTPEVTMQTQLTAAVKKAPGNPFVRVKPGVFGLLRYPEISAEERAAAAAPKSDGKADKADGKSEEPNGRSRQSGSAAAGEGSGRGRRRRRGAGRGRDERRPAAGPGGAAAEAGAGTGDDNDIEEPNHGGLSAEARAAALAETGVLEGDDETAGDEETPRAMDAMEDEAAGGPAPAGAADAEGRQELAADGDDADDGQDDEGDDGAEGALDEGPADEGAADEGTTNEGQRAGEGELGTGRRRRRRRRRGGRGGEGDFGGAPRSGDAPGGPGGGELGSGQMSASPASATAESNAFSGEGPASGAQATGDGGGVGAGADSGQGPRRIMTPVDAAIEILRGQAPGRGVHVRQIADAASRRRLVHGEPNEAWRVMRTALAAEPRERLRGGQRPRLRAAGAGLFALSRRPPEGELERAEQVFGEARRALRERTVASLERRLAELPASAFEALARVLLQREGFGPATFVKRVEGTVYVEALRGRGGRPSRCLIGLRFGGATAAKGAILELRYGIRARGQDEGLLMLGGRLSDEAIAAWKQPGPPIEIADGPAMAETCIRHGVGVINTMVSVDFVDADFFAEIAEG
ncbi:MAG TPA: HTH domain-containing protein, partial [Polyangia bacterium]|nr:HTH domain-containing protein [Polyangia bacterium]